MHLIRPVLSLLLSVTALKGGDLDVYLLNTTLSPRSETREGSLDPITGRRLGKTVNRGGDLRQLGLGVATTVLSPGNWRVRLGAEGTLSASATDMSLHYLRFQGTSQFSADTDGRIKASTLAPLVSLVYVSSGAGEYGITYEHHLTKVTYDIASTVLVNDTVTPPNTPQSLSKRFSDPFLSVNATFVQRYRSFGLFARVSYGVNLASVPSLSDLSEADFLGNSEALLNLARPRQELKLAVGTRF